MHPIREVLKKKQARVVTALEQYCRMNPYLENNHPLIPKKMNAQEILEAIRRLSVEEQFWLLRNTIVSLVLRGEVDGVAEERAEQYRTGKEEAAFTEKEIDYFIERLVLILKHPEKRQVLLNILSIFYPDDIASIRLSKSKPKEEPYDFFKSAGLWAGRNIDGKKLRHDAWRIKE
jgi:hypothetical protein